ncbi:PREDICTED: uncharacterized protein LOC109472623 [Branchiostoma belcheri]|uniref:Uncharacterized protein LOC109472623 n=1 Tax=Branchiostoma belcheri TaxID=7741 RepID=A0A6P4YFJ2_BRABE|nr:PREDICTED: uncharacterized protein LOC109472623 [Branchiostoma belcheri]
MPFGTRFLQSPSGAKNYSTDMAEPDFLDLHNFLADDIIRTREGGTGWMVDRALNAERCNPKTFLLKTRKCSENGSIVLEPALSPENYINSKSESTGGFFGVFASKRSVSISESLSEESVKTTIVSESSAVSQHKYAFVKSTDARGTVRFRIAPNAGFGASVAGSKSTSSSVEVFCEDLVRKSVDFEDLRGALGEHTVNTSATNIQGEDSLFVVTDVIVAGKISWEVKQNVESKKSGGAKVDVEPVNVGAEGGTSSQRPQEHRQVVNNAVLALKLAKVSYNSEGKIVRLDKSGSFEGNYTFGPGNEEREGQIAIKLLGSGENVRENSSLWIHYIPQEKRRRQRMPNYKLKTILGIGHQVLSDQVHIDQISLQCIVERGKYQRKVHKSWQLPLKGLVVTRERDSASPRRRIPWKKKKKERISLKKVAVTDVQADNTSTCVCNSELDIPKEDWVWLDCKQWRESLTKHEIQVDVEYKDSVRTLTVDEEDPIFVIMHKMRDKLPCHKQALTYKGSKIEYKEDTIKDLGVKDGDKLIMTRLVKDGIELYSQTSDCIAYGATTTNVSLPLEDIQTIGGKYPELKMDEGRVRQILQKEFSTDDQDISLEGFQQLMEAVGKKVERDDIHRAFLDDEDSSDDEFNVLDMMTSSFEGRSWLSDDEEGSCASNVNPKFPRSLSFEEQEYMDRASSDTEAEEYSSEDGGCLVKVKIPGLPEQKTLPTVPGFSEAKVEEASKLLQARLSLRSENLQAVVSDIDWETVDQRRMNWSDVQLSGLDDLGESDKFKALRLLKRQTSGKDKEDEEVVSKSLSSVEERVQLGPNLAGGASPMDSSHDEAEKFS